MSMTASPLIVPHFSALAPGYDVLLCDVWGVVHNGLRSFPPSRAMRLMRARARGAVVILITNAPRPNEAVIAPARPPAGAARGL